MGEKHFQPSYINSHRERMSDKHRREVKAFLREEAPALLALEPLRGRRAIRTHLIDGLYVVARRNKDRTVSRFLLARLSVNNKVREKGLGRVPGTDLFDAWRAVMRLHIDAQAERKVARDTNPDWGKRRAEPARRRRRVVDVEG